MGSAAAASACSGVQQSDMSQVAPATGGQNQGTGGISTTGGQNQGAGGLISTGGISASGGITASGGHVDSGGIVQTGGTTIDSVEQPITCDGGTPQLLGDITPAVPGSDQPDLLLSSISRQQVFDSANGPSLDASMSRAVYIDEEVGVICGDASDAVGCESNYAQATDPYAICGDTPCSRVLVATASNDTLIADTQNGQLSRLLGEVDTYDEAALVAWLNGIPIACDGGSPDWPVTTVQRIEDGYLIRSTAENCGESKMRWTVKVSTNGAIEIVEQVEIAPPSCAIGRRPEGLCTERSLISSNQLGSYLSSMAHLEAASVVSFARIARELQVFGAPQDLVDSALAAAQDEVRHAGAISLLCQRFGGTLGEVTVEPAPPRDRWHFALDNAIEGCVRETFGALMGTYQAMTAADPIAKAVLETIAEDEIRHAQLSRELAAFIEPQLSEQERGMLRHAQAAALVQLARELDSGMGDEERRMIGLPDAATSKQLLTQLTQALFPYASAGV